MQTKEQRKEYSARRYVEHRDEILAQQKKYYADHRDVAQKYHAKHRDEILARQKKYRTEHRNEMLVRGRKRYAVHRNEMLARQKQHYIKLRAQCLNHYGTVCACRGETITRFLTIDHINGDGARHRREVLGNRGQGGEIYRWLIKNNFPEGFQTLCFNCNCGRAINGGICPHKSYGVATLAQAQANAARR